jgi:3-deoxy-manno-octulosonate cytidylyltransferase (CMP-KDO synthetase)
LLPIQGKPMIQWVYERASSCELLNKVIVATDSSEIADLIKSCGGDVEFTDPNIRTGSDRVSAVSEKYPNMDIVINLQGDELFIKPRMLEQLVEPYLIGDSPEVTTLAYKLDIEHDYENPGVVKVITDLNGDAIYFSRSSIPHTNKQPKSGLGSVPIYHHMGLYAFRRDFLLKYKDLPQTPLELSESLEQLRVLEHGYRIRVCITEEKTLEINTPEDLVRAETFQYNTKGV